VRVFSDFAADLLRRWTEVARGRLLSAGTSDGPAVPLG
jgi:hypothetical protein